MGLMLPAGATFMSFFAARQPLRHSRKSPDDSSAQALEGPMLETLNDVTKAGPLGMLPVAFIGGMLFARRR